MKLPAVWKKEDNFLKNAIRRHVPLLKKTLDTLESVIEQSDGNFDIIMMLDTYPMFINVSWAKNISNGERFPLSRQQEYNSKYILLVKLHSKIIPF